MGPEQVFPVIGFSFFRCLYTPALAARFVTFDVLQRFFQLSQIIAGDILIGFRPGAENQCGLIHGFRIGYAVTERAYRIDILAF
jgi:hypothetical protein